jgi:16S rRNA (guanine966-N2)-methyltransferase
MWPAAMRVIAGTARGRRLTAPAGRGTRPTGDRVKEALFSSLGRLHGAVVLDLYAGSGALALEALSRGAARAVLVEQDPKALQAIAANLEATGLGERATVVRGDAVRFCRRPDGGPFDLVLLDPPYGEPQEALFARLEELRAAAGLAPDACVAMERAVREPDPDPPSWLAREGARTYGDTMLRYFRYRQEDEQ